MKVTKLGREGLRRPIVCMGFQKYYALYERELQGTESSTHIIVHCSMEDTSWGSRDGGKILTSLCIRCDVVDGIDLAEDA